MVQKEAIEHALAEVMDPELHMSIVDLGLIYEIKVDRDMVLVRMTLTTLGCPLFDTIRDEMIHAVGKIGVKESQFKIDLTFEPPWSMDRMSERAKAMLGI